MHIVDSAEYKINNVSLSYGKKQILHNISFMLKKDAITVLLGSNGSGKSTLLTYLMMSNFQNSRIVKSKISYVAQKDYLDPYDTVSGQFKFQAKLDGIKFTRESILSSKIQQALGIDKIWLKRINNLSGGQKRAVSLGLAFIKNPQFLLLDEPTASLDIDVRNQFWRAVIDYKKMHHLTILFTTHNMWEVEKFANNVLVVKAGKLHCELTKDEFSNLVNGHVITLAIPQINDLQHKIHSEISKNFQSLELLHSDENNIKYINNQKYSIDDIFKKLKAIILAQSGGSTKIAINSASIDDSYYYVLEKMGKANVKIHCNIE